MTELPDRPDSAASAEPGTPEGAGPLPCVRHPDRPTALRCTRCERPACPECLREASVGYHCVDCVREAQHTIRRPVTVAGAQLGTRPIVVPALIALNVLIYLFTAVQAGSVVNNETSALFGEWALWPPAVAGGQWWRLITSGFLHYGPLHLAFNMVALWVIGKDLELILGKLRFSAIYATSLLGGGVSVYLLGAVNGQVAGASGAVFGLMGGVAVAAIRLRLSPAPALTVIGLNVVISLSVPGISLLGHLGGLVVGAIATIGMVYPPAPQRARWQIVTIAGLVVVLLALIVFRTAAFTECTTVPMHLCVPAGFGR